MSKAIPIREVLVTAVLVGILAFGFNALASTPVVAASSDCTWWCPSSGWGSAPVECGEECRDAVIDACGNDIGVFSTCDIWEFP